MSILFRCPCGRSMVVESDRAGAVVMCPNCRRSLKVPSGKDRGVELASAPAATKTRTSRLCPRCRKDIPVDSQLCPHCNAIVMGGPAAASAPAAKAVAAKAPTAAARAAGIMGSGEAQQIVYGGSRATWWNRLSAGGKAGVLGGIAAFILVLGIITYFIYSSWYAGQVVTARTQTDNALKDGRKLECEGKFQEAYELYWSAVNMVPYLRSTGQQTDAALADGVEARAAALIYLASEPKIRLGESVYWKPKSQQEYDRGMEHLRQTYPTYKNFILGVADAGIAACQVGKAGNDQAAFAAKISRVMDAYMILIAKSTEQQRAQFTFQTMLSGIREMAFANGKWSNAADRANLLNRAEDYFSALKDRVNMSAYPDAVPNR